MKYVFVCGVHRSGTSTLAQKIGQLKDCAGFGSTGRGNVLDEGQYLQDVYEPDTSHGGVGRFGFDSRSHLTESSPLLTSDNITRLRQSWEAYWDKDKTIRVEKTPGNLLKTRFLQAAFPNAYFIVIKRHPVAVSLATQKWSRTPLHDLFKHWLRCHEILDEDKNRLEHLYELCYEDYIKNPGKYLEEIASFIGTEVSGSLQEEAAAGYNMKYFDQWAQMLQRSRFKSYYRCVACEYQPKFAAHGYSLLPSSSEPSLSLEDKLVRRSIAEMLFIGAEIYSPFWRADLWLRVRAHRIVDNCFPAKVRASLFPRRAKTAREPKQPA